MCCKKTLFLNNSFDLIIIIYIIHFTHINIIVIHIYKRIHEAYMIFNLLRYAHYIKLNLNKQKVLNNVLIKKWLSYNGSCSQLCFFLRKRVYSYL